MQARRIESRRIVDHGAASTAGADFGRLLVAFSTLVALAVASGCASVPMAAREQDAIAKNFPQPAATKAGLYLFRDSFGGQALRKNLSLDGQLIGATANRTYFYREVAAGGHVLATESEFGDNTLQLDLVAGRNDVVRQFIRMGVLVGGSDVELVGEDEGRKAVLECELAQPVAADKPTASSATAVAHSVATSAPVTEKPRWVGQAKKPRAVPIDDDPAPRPAAAPAVLPPLADRGSLALVSASLLKYQAAAERYARDHACHRDPVASLAAIGPTAEIYTVACTRDDAMIVRCDANECHAMQ